MKLSLEPRQLRTLTAFGRGISAESYLFTPENEDEIHAIFDLARQSGKKVVMRGAGRSYGDASLANDQIAISLEKMKTVLSFEASSGLIEVQGGITLLELCRFAVGHGFWPPVVSGTSRTTIAGAIAMNIHGKNQFQVGTFCEHCIDYSLVTPQGTLSKIDATSELGQAIAGNLGLFGVLVSATIRLEKVKSPFVSRQRFLAKNWVKQFQLMKGLLETCNYLTTWVDGTTNGVATVEPAFSDTSHQDISKRPHLPIGPGPHSLAATLGPLALKVAIQPSMLGFTNFLRRTAVKFEGEKAKQIDLFRYNFQLDWMWNWDQAYLPGALIQFQSVVPAAVAEETFTTLVDLCKKRGFTPTLVVIKRHRPGIGLLDYLDDGFSIAIDLNQRSGSQSQLRDLYSELVEISIHNKGRIYLAKDFLMTAEQFRRSPQSASLPTFKQTRLKLDPERLITSSLAERLQI